MNSDSRRQGNTANQSKAAQLEAQLTALHRRGIGGAMIPRTVHLAASGAAPGFVDVGRPFWCSRQCRVTVPVRVSLPGLSTGGVHEVQPRRCCS